MQTPGYVTETIADRTVECDRECDKETINFLLQSLRMKTVFILRNEILKNDQWILHISNGKC